MLPNSIVIRGIEDWVAQSPSALDKILIPPQIECIIKAVLVKYEQIHRIDPERV